MKETKKKKKGILSQYNPKILLKGLKLLEKGGLKNRFLMNLYLANASVAYNPLVSASIGFVFGKEVGTTVMAIVAFAYQIGKLFLPILRNVPMIKLMKMLLIGDILSIMVMLLTLITDSKMLLVIGIESIQIVTISMLFAYQTHLRRWMSRKSQRRHLIKPYDYIQNGTDVLAKFFISAIIAVSGMVYAEFGLILGMILVGISIKYQLRFMEELKKELDKEEK